MNLSPTELERLTIFTAAEFARRNLRSGVRLSHPEAVAYLTDEAMVLARSDVPFAEVRRQVGRLLDPDQVESGVGSMIPFIMLELPTPAGSKLLTIYEPIPAQEGDVVPGEVTAVAEPEFAFDTEDLVELDVVNTGDRDVQVRSLTHFFEVNRALEFDREAAYGRKLAIASGAGIRFEPGIPRRVPLVPIGGERKVYGQAGLVNGALDDPSVRVQAFEKARARGYLQEKK